ncbi:MAG: T9SS type A sorting domain-containing protein, partial [Bacteroidales bacterium]|nr:T9SS type A sorting domain-containing protein [Bacteroidales bacterium]
WSASNKGWQFISSPFIDATTASFESTEGDFDLYRYDGSKENEWVNYKNTGDDSGEEPELPEVGGKSEFSFDFEDGTLTGLRAFAGEGSNAPLWAVTNDSYYSNGTNVIYSASYDDNTWMTYASINNYIVTENAYAITAESKLSWYVRHTNYNAAYADVYEVVVSEDGETFTQIWSGTAETSVQEQELSLAEYAGKNLYIGFRHYCVDEYGGDALVLDNISLTTGSKTRNSNTRSFDEETFAQGVGYLASYEIQETATLVGTFNTKTSFDYKVSYTADKELANFHLLGNPFTFNMDWSNITVKNVYEAFATVDPSTGGYIQHINGTIPVGDGFFVKAKGENPSISYNAGSKSRGENVEYINVVASGKQGSNNVIIKLSGKEEKGFSKLENLNQSIADIYVKNNGRQYSVLGYDNDVKEVELFFDAKEMGNYTIGIEPNGKFQSVTLVDRMTGAETNMLLDSYTFTATANDNPNRFLIRLDNGQSATDGNFVYQSGEELIVDAEGTIQIIDVMGRMVYSNDVESSNNRINVSNLKGATYIVRNISNNTVRTQKIVIL